MSQRPSTAEEVSDSLCALEESVEKSWVGVMIEDSIKLAVRQGFAHTKRQNRIVIAMQTMGIRLIRTTHVDKNLMTELRALSAGCESGSEEQKAVQQKGRLLQFPGVPASRKRSASGGSDPLDVA